MNKISYEEFNKWKDCIRKKDLFLDVGCWGGAQVLNFNDKCYTYGVDYNKTAIGLADKKIKNKLKYADITKGIPFDKKFDWVLFTEVLEHIKDEDAALENISKVLKTGGRLIMSTPKSIKFFEWWDPAWIRWKFGGTERHYHFTLKELKDKLSNHGIIIKEYSIAGTFPWLIARWINVFLKYIIHSKKTIWFGQGNGYYDWMIIAEKI